MRVFTLDESRAWDETVRSFPHYDVYYLSGYVKAFKIHGDGEPLLFYYESDTFRAADVVMKRDVALARHFKGLLPEGKYFDLATPYGYGGWIADKDDVSNEDKNKLTLSKDEYKKLCRQAARLNKKQMISCARALQFIPCKNKDIYSCTAGDRLLAILADGSVMPCRRLPITVGNVKKTDLLSIYRDSPELIKMRNTTIPGQCEQCEFSEHCRGGARCITYAKTGRYDLPDPDCVLLK